MKTPEFPKEITKGSCKVFIYRHDNKGYETFTLAYYEDDKRKRETSSDYGALRTRADEVLKDLKDGRTNASPLSAAQRNDYAHALQILKPTGVSLDLAVRHFARAVEILGSDLVVIAAQEYAKRHHKVEPRLLSEAVEEFITEKERQQQAGQKSEVHVSRLASRLRALSGAVVLNVASVTAPDIDIFLDSLKSADGPVSARTRDNWAGDITNFFNWAKRKRYVPSDFDEAERITRIASDTDGPIEIYSPDELEALLKTASKEFGLFLAIGAFAGLRTSEFLRLDWSDVKFEDGNSQIIVQKGKVKQRGKSRRIVPMLDNLKAWLEPHAKASGPVWPHSAPLIYKIIRLRLLPAAKKELEVENLKWKSNALRHSFISYRLALVKNVHQVTLEAGNSEQMVFSNYREIVSEPDAKRWFEIYPEKKKGKQP